MPNTKEVEQQQWDWYGWLCARIPVLKEGANKFWIHQCVEMLTGDKTIQPTLQLSDYKKQISELQSMLMTERRRNCKALSNPLEQSEKKEEWVSNLTAKELFEMAQEKRILERKPPAICPQCKTKNYHYYPLSQSWTCAFC